MSTLVISKQDSRIDSERTAVYCGLGYSRDLCKGSTGGGNFARILASR